MQPPAVAGDGRRKERVSDTQSARDEKGVGPGLKQGPIEEPGTRRSRSCRQELFVEGCDQRGRRIDVETLVGRLEGWCVLPRLLVEVDVDRNLAAGHLFGVCRRPAFGAQAVGVDLRVVTAAVTVDDGIHHLAGECDLSLQRPDDEQAEQQQRTHG